MSPRLAVRKTYKLYVGGAFVRSESGRHDPSLDRKGDHVANIPRASRKDVRDAVRAARAAQGPWAAKTAYNRGQILYRVAEALESRSAEHVDSAVRTRGLGKERAAGEVAAAIDALVHYAGWTDKLAAVLGGVNPVAGPHLSISTPEPTGVVAVLASPAGALTELVEAIAPALATGSTVVAAVSERWPTASLDLAEVLEVSDVPAGVVNLLSGRIAELAPVLAGHRDVNAIVDATGDRELAAEVGKLAAETIKRVVRIEPPDQLAPRPDDRLRRLAALTELRTSWHPVGA